jgi:biopolymer transport protein ExbD
MRLRRKRKSKVDVEEIDITSLLDILVILLVFLLKSFNDSGLTIDLVNELALPYSMTRGVAHNGVVLQMNKNKELYLNSKLIGLLDAENTKSKLEQKLTILYQEKLSTSKEQKSQIINFIFDKGLQYVDIHKVLDLSSNAGFSKYKLIVQGTE